MEVREPGAKHFTKPAYKKTEVGVLPEDWIVVSMGSLGTFRKGAGIRKDEANSGDIACVRYGELYTHHNDIIRHFNSRVSLSVAKSSTQLQKGDLLFAGSGETKEEIGKCAAFLAEEETYAGGDILILSPKDCVSAFLGYLFNAPCVKRQKSSKGQGDAIVHISASALSSVRIPLPPTRDEQQAIAEALSDVDVLIESLEQLLGKKRQIKQGAMQELLTGRKRLPSFAGDWEILQVGEIAHVKTGPFGSALHESDYVETGTPIITVEHLGEFGVTRQNLPMVSDIDYRRLEAYSLEVGDIVFSRVGAVDRNALIRDSENGWLFSGRLLRVRPDRRKVFPPFLSYQFHNEAFRNSVIAVAVGQTMASLNTRILNNLSIVLPSIAEQTAIANILSDMDAEIAVHEAKLAKIRDLKQGMMQELLTGKIRLV